MPVRGVEHVMLALRDLAKAVDVPMNAASRHALAPTLEAAKGFARAAPFDDTSGTLARSLVIRKDTKRSRKLAPVHRVGPKKGASITWKGRKRNPVRYAHLVEFGTISRGKPGGGHQFPGARKKPFLTPAYQATKKEVVNRFNAQIGPEMEKRARKLKARQVLRR